ncbi:MAG: hypothetical protein JWL79_2124 [Frankiales bacterium]|nr:hypothetical protein [Frankiales bacterium]
MADLTRALSELLDAPPHPDPVGAVIAQGRGRRRRQMASAVTAVVLTAGGAAAWGLTYGGAKTTLATPPPASSPPFRPIDDSAVTECMIGKGWQPNGPSGFQIAGPGVDPRMPDRRFEADRADCITAQGVHVVVQAAPIGVPYDESTAPNWFRNRPALGSDLQRKAAGGDNCGYFDLGLQGQLPSSAHSCMASAIAGAGAELGVSRNTDEGDPVITYYRVSSQLVEIFTDATRDKFGSGEWSVETCASLDPETLQATGCRPG